MKNESTIENKHWIIPMSAKRVKSDQKGNEVGMQQVVNSINELGLSDKLSISIGDSLYGTEKCRMFAAEQKNLVHIFRLNSKRNLFSMPKDQQNLLSKKGRKKEFGVKMNLGNPNTYLNCDQTDEISWENHKGKKYLIKIKHWKNMLLRGSKKFRASQYPLNVTQVIMMNDQGKIVVGENCSCQATATLTHGGAFRMFEDFVKCFEEF